MGVRTVFQDRVGRLLNKGIELQLGTELLHFESEDEYKTFLKSRSNAAAESLAKLKGLSPDRLERQLQHNERVYKHILGLLLQVVEHEAHVDVLWRELDISELPDEQQWPAILFAISSNEELRDELKRESIERFVEFLRARRKLILRLQELSAEQAAAGQQTAELPAAVDPAPEACGGDVTGVDMTAGRDYCRLPHGTAVALTLHEAEPVNLYLSRWKIALRLQSGSVFVDENGHSHPLHQGENSIGRSSGCTIVLERAPLDVSRKHLVIEWVDGRQLVLRDVSSKGTWMPGECLQGNARAEMSTAG